MISHLPSTNWNTGAAFPLCLAVEPLRMSVREEVPDHEERDTRSMLNLHLSSATALVASQCSVP
jgi:hypothetical protein